MSFSASSSAAAESVPSGGRLINERFPWTSSGDSTVRVRESVDNFIESGLLLRF